MHRAVPLVWAVGQSLLAAAMGLKHFALEALIAIGPISVLLLLPFVGPLRRRWELLLLAMLMVLVMCAAGIYVGLKDCSGSFCDFI